MPFPLSNNPVLQRQLIRVGVILLIGFVAWLVRSPDQQPQQRQPLPDRRVELPPERTTLPTPGSKQSRSAEAEEEPNAAPSLVMRSLVLRDEDGGVVYRGDIDLQPTLARITDDRKLRFSHDGTVFENRERRLPRQASGYYHEWVVPTPGERGPGPQRLIVGDDGDIWYTSDHYRTFRRIKYDLP
jgi:ribonuclease T1